MDQQGDARKDDLIDKVVALASDRLDPVAAEPAARFIRLYLANVPPDDLLPRPAEVLYAQALSLWAFARRRPIGRPKVRVFNPTLEEHGWRCDHTVVEVINDDMPFLVDSLTAELGRLDLGVRLAIHPIMRFVRDEDGLLSDVGPMTHPTGLAESVMHIEVTEQSDPARLTRAAQGAEAVLAAVLAAVEDWLAMRETCRAIASELETLPVGDQQMAQDMGEARDFLRWLQDDHFTFLGYRTYAFPPGQSAGVAVPEPGLGILRSPEAKAFGELRNLASLPEEVRAFVDQRTALIITKSSERARVHRPVAMDAIGIKDFDEEGTRVIGLRLFVGLFTADVYTSSPSVVPMLRTKIERVVDRSALPSHSHDGKKLMNILENLPRDELFQMSEDQLLATALGILHLQERQRTALFLRQDEFQRFISCLVFVPRDRHDTALRLAIQDILERALNGRVDSFSTLVSDAPLARIHFIVGTTPGQLPQYESTEIERRVAEAARSWSDHLHDALVAARGEETGLRQFTRYAKAFPAGYRERVTAVQAVGDIARIDEALGESGFAMTLYRSIEDADHEVRFKVFTPGKALPLSDVLPMLENMGFKVMGEVPFKVRPQSENGPQAAWVHDFLMTLRGGGGLDIGKVRQSFQDSFARLWHGDIENDGFNKLVVLAGLTWRQVVILRAYSRFLRQAAFPSSQAAIEETMATHPDIAALLVALFEARFDPDSPNGAARASGDATVDRAPEEARIVEAIRQALDGVDSPDEDRILRRYLNLVTSSLRTNHYQLGADGVPKPYLSIKLDSRAIDELPAPRPWVEVFVYSPRVEAIHLRGGKVARGGIRWSDRREDFRTEVLGLMKAQMVKNAVIVPVGSKGGFVVKKPPVDAGREALLAEGIACYKILMAGLLDLTDNLDGDRVVPPPRVVRHDGDDPYLVVAADKGTATFSDIANGVSADYGFWLSDAFASGGSNGYDHKAMGITARGAWEAVKRHFREQGRDIQSEPTTVIGVGDMSGDVFGNALQLSPALRLIGAFNHQHIFVDPAPDPAVAFAERERLFRLPRSAWSDYDATKLSAGGTIYERRAKQITLTPEIRALFGFTRDRVTPTELIRALLTAEVDLLWFGGIGTYIKARGETDIQVGDRANDALRVDGADIRAKVVGEGANLGVTQRGRIEYALKGGRINTDAIDNSAGVDCSDHEVNIKILLDGVLRAGDMTAKQRNALLGAMTDDVAALVLRHNTLQTQAISLTVAQDSEVLDHQGRFMRLLERAGRLDRALEFLPDDDILAERAAQGRGLTRPEVAVLMPYAKLWLFDEIVDSNLPDDPALQGDLVRYFPAVLGERFPEALQNHRLKREIIATVATNSMINRVGGTFVTQMIERTGMNPSDVARAYIVTRDAYGLRGLWAAIEALDGKVPAAVQLTLLKDINRLIAHSTLWLLRNGVWPLDLAAAGAPLAETAGVLADHLPDILAEDQRPIADQRIATLVEAGVPIALARVVAGVDGLAAANDIARIASLRSLPIDRVAALYFRVGAEFGMAWMRGKAEELDHGSHWTKLAVSAIVEDLFVQQRHLALAALDCSGEVDDPAGAVACWKGTNPKVVERTAQLLSELRGAPIVDLAMLTVAARQFRALSGL
ncbi:NAD-glutamate dehydrogenase [Rhodospirillum rubrum]|uniref:NAD-glutamate dehydrogenase n=1 Tax=Rhodospirillum rubrum TaxID=1085 RepID=UPI001908C7C7|nr:NAD-glutamate dehydrogenase [Rhodospirillum rubrum]MBK1663268.1 NAD-glutamate dehydrogenase [Rhodospirillum rubrum]MBK1677076.1 NAD-glutamate dehydrogenase [Rhodospirillum rubrum]